MEEERSPIRRTLFSNRGRAIKSQAREFVCSVREYFEKEKKNGGPLISVEKVVDRTAAALGIHRNSVSKIFKEKKTIEESASKVIDVTNTVEESAEITDESNAGPSKLVTPGKKRKRVAKVTKLDSFQENGIRQHVYQYFLRREHPTLKKLTKTLAESGLFTGSRSSVRKILFSIGFFYGNLSGRNFLMEREDIVAWRCRFLREIRKEDFNNVVWLDETWVNAGHTPKRIWQDNKKESMFKAPIGRGGRIIVLHAGTSAGFIPECLLIFKSKKTGHYQEEMNHDVFSKWFEDCLLPKLHEPSTIVMDNASYHSVVADKAPTMASRKIKIIEWLNNKNIQFEETLNKSELIQIVNAHKPQTPVYIIDEIAYSKGHKVLRLPPYHCHFNPIEMIWAQMKGYVARNNKTFTIAEVDKLTRQAVDNITSDNWRSAVHHVRTTIEEAWKKDALMEEAVEDLIISVSATESDSSSSSCSISLSGFEELE